MVVVTRRREGSSEAQPACSQKALDLLARRPHFEAELRAKLSRRAYDGAEVEAVLDRLREQRLVDDRRLAADYVARRREERPMGRRRLLAELVRRGVDGDLAAEVLAPISEEEEEEAARRAMLLWKRRGGVERAALARHLERRGFGARAILALLDETGDGASVAAHVDRAVSPDPAADS